MYIINIKGLDKSNPFSKFYFLLFLLFFPCHSSSYCFFPCSIKLFFLIFIILWLIRLAYTPFCSYLFLFFDFQKPTANPARYAAPNAVVSVIIGLITFVPVISAWNCIKKLFLLAPPSTLILLSLTTLNPLPSHP